MINPISLNNQHNPTSISQVTLNNENLSPSNSPNQYNTPSNTPPAVPPNSVSHSTSFIPTLPPFLFLSIILFLLNLFLQILQSLLFLKLLLLLHNLPHIILMFLFIQLFKISPLPLTNLLLTPLNLLFPLQQSLSTPLLFNHFLLFPTPLLSLLLHFPIPLNCLMALIILTPLKNSWHILVLE